jgi:hypothetical protein
MLVRHGLLWRNEIRCTAKLDCFSAGCVIAELFLEGLPLFTLSQLFNIVKANIKLIATLDIGNEGVQVSAVYYHLKKLRGVRWM